MHKLFITYFFLLIPLLVFCQEPGKTLELPGRPDVNEPGIYRSAPDTSLPVIYRTPDLTETDILQDTLASMPDTLSAKAKKAPVI
ncbi:MAG: hypothetical protein PHH93_06460, partial [Prolixibacteraceae bacterium]|nr:hypothetical protein [Prolixibacteraceae bacterium]